MSIAELPEPKPNEVERLLDDLGGRQEKVSPLRIAQNSRRFELVLSSVIAPFIGLNAFLIGGIALVRLFPAQLPLLFFCNLGAALALAGYLYSRRKQPDRIPVLYLSALPTLVVAASLMLQADLVALVVAVVVSYVFASLVCQSKVPQSAVPIYIIYLPILLCSLQRSQGWRIAIEILCLIPLGYLFISWQFRTAVSAVVFSAVIAATYESNSSSAPVVMLLVFLVAMAVWSEIRVTKADFSSLRMTLDQSLVALLGYLALVSVNFTSSTDKLIWSWAGAVSAYEAFRSWREKLGYPSRIAVAAGALTIALWVTDNSFPIPLPIAGVLLIAALTSLAALRLKISLLSTVGFLLLIPGAVSLHARGQDTVSVTVLVLGLLTTAAGVLIAASPSFGAAHPWWQGFIRKKDLDWIKNAAFVAGNALLQVPFVGFVFRCLRSVLLWLRYIKGENTVFALRDIMYAAAHFYGAGILSRQMQLLAAAHGASVNIQLAYATAVWVLWGLAVFVSGVRSAAIYKRYVGLVLVGAPVALYFASLDEKTGSMAVVAMLVGGAFLMAGLARRLGAAEEQKPSEKLGAAQ